MNQKQIGIVLLVVGILVTALVFAVKEREDAYVEAFMKETGSCFLEDGTCLHADQNLTLYIFGWTLSAALIILGIYLVFFDRTQQLLAAQHLKVSESLKEAKQKDEFKAFLRGFDEKEQKVLSAIKEQDGIQQSTLRYRTGISKSQLSLMLKAMEEKKIISRAPKGKTNQVFLQKNY